MAVITMEGLDAGIVEKMEGGSRCTLHGSVWDGDESWRERR